MPFKNQKIAFLLVYTNKNQSEAHVRSKNYLSYIGAELNTFRNGEVFWGTSEDLLVKEAFQKDFDYGLIIREGTVFLSWTAFIEEIEKVWTSEHFCLGHILDRSDKYYEIHNQCIFLDLNKMANMGFPSYQENLDKPSTMNQVLRSKENFHDDYTPIAVAAEIGKTVTYEKISRGSHWINEAFNCRYKISPFPEEAREMKEFFYPEHLESYESNKIYIKDSIDSDTQSFFLYNTEDFAKRDNIKPLNKIIIPASGLMPLYILRHYGYAAQTSVQMGQTEVVIYDISHIQLELYRKLIFEWDGFNYRQFVEKYMGFNLLKGQTCEKFDRELFVKYFGTEEIFRDWLFELREKCNFNFIRVNALAKNFNTQPWLEMHPDDSGYLSLSNVFHYWPTSIDLSYKYRITTLNQLMEKLKTKAPNMWVNFCRPESIGNGKICPRSHLIQARDYQPEKPLPMPWEESFILKNSDVINNQTL